MPNMKSQPQNLVHLWTLLLAGLLISTLSSGCKTKIVVVQSDDVVTRVVAGVAYVPTANGWVMSDSLYLRYRRAVADKIAELKETK